MNAWLKALIVALVFHTAPAQAQSPADVDARTLFVQGDAAYAEGRYETALTLFQEAYAMSGRPALLYNLANVLERLGRTEEAVDHLRRFEEHAAPAQREIIHRRMEALEARLASERQAAAERELENALERDWASAPPAVSGPAIPWGGILSGGAALLLVGGGVALGAVGHSIDLRAFGACVAANNGAICPASAASDLSSGQNLALAADVTFGVGAALAVTGIVLFVVELSAPSQAASSPEPASEQEVQP